MQHHTAVVEVSFTRSSRELIAALAQLMHALEHADQALLEDTIADAHKRMRTALQGDRPFGFRLDT